jgi:hypothetical protein
MFSLLLADAADIKFLFFFWPREFCKEISGLMVHHIVIQVVDAYHTAQFLPVTGLSKMTKNGLVSFVMQRVVVNLMIYFMSRLF